MRHKPVGKLSRSLGIAITPKAAKVLDARESRPGQHGRARHNLSDYGRRLREKQRLREQYYISETHLRRTFAEAQRRPGATGENQRRLDRPGARLCDGDVVTVREHSWGMPIFLVARETRIVEQTPPYLEVRNEVLTARVVRAARRAEVPVTCDEQLVIEYYAR